MWLKEILPKIATALKKISYRLIYFCLQEDEEKVRKEKRETQDFNKFLWVYR